MKEQSQGQELSKFQQEIQERERKMYDIYAVEIQWRDKVYGGVPRNPEVITAWLKERVKKANKAGLEIPNMTEEQIKEIEGQIEISEDSTWNTFKTIYGGKEVGPYLDSYNVKAMLKECASMLRYTTNVNKVGKNNETEGRRLGFKQHMQHGVHIKPVVLRLGEAVEGSEEIAGYVSSPQGKKAILRKADYIMRPTIAFEIWSIANGTITEDMFFNMLIKGQENGLGAMRSREVDKFDLLAFKKIHTGKL